MSTNTHTTKQSKTKKNISQANNKSSKLLSTKKRQKLNEKNGAAVASDIVLNGGDKKKSLLDEKSSSNNDKSSLIHEKSSPNNENAEKPVEYDEVSSDTEDSIEILPNKRKTSFRSAPLVDLAEDTIDLSSENDENSIEIFDDDIHVIDWLLALHNIALKLVYH